MLGAGDLRSLSVRNLRMRRSKPQLTRTSTGTVDGGADALAYAVRRMLEDPQTSRKLLLTRPLLIRRRATWQVMP